MSKITYILAFMLCAIFSYGQDVVFHENVNYRASILKQRLENNGHFLVLESENNQILQIDIFNESFSKNIKVNRSKTRINLNSLPPGNFVIQAKVGQKWIIMYLEKNGGDKIANSNRKDQYVFEKSALSAKQPKSVAKTKKPVYYWVVYENNSSFGSSKSMRLEYKDDVFKLISKHKLELKSKVGKNNTLIVYEVYDTSKFMKKQLRNPEYYKSAEDSTFFNTNPLYASNTIETD